MKPERMQWMTERLLLEELPGPLRDELKGSPGTDERLARLRQADADFFSEFPPERVVPQIREKATKARKQPEPRRRGAILLVALAACAVAVISVQREPVETHRAKGLRPSLSVYRSQAAGPELLHEGAVVRAGDTLQLVYLPAGRRYGAIISVDGAGAVTPHFPEQAAVAAPLPRGAEVILPNGYRLDAAPRFERFWFVTSTEPFELKPVLEAARSAAASEGFKLKLPASLEQFTFTVRKAP